MPRVKVAIVGPVFPFRAGIAYCTTRLADELGADVVSFSRQFPKRFYPGGDDTDPTLPRAKADFIIDVMNPLTWLRAGWRLRRYDAVIFVWWVWLFAPAYLIMIALLRRRTSVILQCHNVGDKEPAAWKRWLTNRVLRRGDALVVHAQSEAREAWTRSGGRQVVTTFLPVHELGGAIPSRTDARATLGITAPNVALFFGHVRPFKGLDVARLARAEGRRAAGRCRGGVVGEGRGVRGVGARVGTHCHPEPAKHGRRTPSLPRGRKGVLRPSFGGSG